METNRREDYIREVLSFVKFKYDHKAIRQELEEHMEDLREDLMAEGMDETAAEYMTVAYMGDAAEIGKELDKEHGAVLGWIWRISRALVIFLLLATAMPLWNMLSSTVGNYFETYRPESVSAEVWHIKLDKEYRVRDDTLLLEGVYFYEDDTLTVVYRTKRNPFAERIGRNADIYINVYDENGESISCSGSGYKKGGYNGIGWKNLWNVPQDAKKLVIDYHEEKITINIETGEVTDNEET